jgi:drug/metabolite transporter (DMT)-like permease
MARSHLVSVLQALFVTFLWSTSWVLIKIGLEDIPPLRTLTAMESSIINNTMLIQIAVLAWVFLGESLGLQQIAGLSLAAVGTLIVQLLGRRQAQRAAATVQR